jgi:hypothetical protein
MLFALHDGTKKLAAKGLEGATCPGCNLEVIPKCGPIMRHHWAHTPASKDMCDPWWEPEGDWHYNWKSDVAGGDPARMEVRITEGKGADRKWHVADALAGNGCIVELQHSPLSPDDVRDREAFYGPRGGMIWIFDYSKRKLHSRDVRLETAEALTLLDLGDRVIGVSNYGRRTYGTWSRAEVVAALSGPTGDDLFWQAYAAILRMDLEAEERAEAEQEARRQALEAKKDLWDRTQLWQEEQRATWLREQAGKRHSRIESEAEAELFRRAAARMVQETTVEEDERMDAMRALWRAQREAPPLTLPDDFVAEGRPMLVSLADVEALGIVGDDDGFGAL